MSKGQKPEKVKKLEAKIVAEIRKRLDSSDPTLIGSLVNAAGLLLGKDDPLIQELEQETEKWLGIIKNPAYVPPAKHAMGGGRLSVSSVWMVLTKLDMGTGSKYNIISYMIDNESRNRKRLGGIDPVTLREQCEGMRVQLRELVAIEKDQS
jgi:hypothetical protein